MNEPVTATPVQAGPYTQGEIPPALVWRFEDANGDPISLADHTAGFVWRRGDDPPVSRDATITDAAGGEVTYRFDVFDMALWGEYRAEFWAGNGVDARYASLPIVYEVAPALAVPDI